MTEQGNDSFILGLTGFTVGFSVLGAELELFFYDMVSRAMANAFHTSIGLTANTGTNFSFFIPIFVILGIVVNLTVSFTFPRSFVTGFIFGDACILLLSASSFWPVAPVVVIGMIVALLVVIGCTTIRYQFEKPKFHE